MEAWEAPEVPSSHRHIEYMATYGAVLWKEFQKLAEWLLHI